MYPALDVEALEEAYRMMEEMRRLSAPQANDQGMDQGMAQGREMAFRDPTGFIFQ